MHIKTLMVGPIGTNCYVVTDEQTRKCVIIDPGDESNTILDYIESNNLQTEAIFITHGHLDHNYALDEVQESTGIAFAHIHKNEVTDDGRRDMYKLKDNGKLTSYSEGDVIKIGGLEFHIMVTPGHSAGSVVIKCENALFTGDTLFRDSCGRTDLEGSMEDMLVSLKRLSNLEGDYEVYPGHGDTTTLSRERSFNQYMQYANE